MFDYSQSEEANLRLALIEANKERDEMSSLYDESLGDLQVAMALEKNRRAERDALQARLDEAVELLRGVTYSFVSLSEQSDSNALDLLSIVRKQRNSDLNNAELFLSTLDKGGA